MNYTEPRKQPESYPIPNEGQNLKPENEESLTEFEDESTIDLDKEKSKIYPKTKPPELY